MPTRKGFTLIEVLVSTAILVIVVVLLASVMDSATRAWRGGQSLADATDVTTAAFDLIASDLRAALAPLDIGADNNLQMIMNPVPAGVESANADSLFWQRGNINSASGPGVAVVGYFVRWGESIDGNPTGRLCRLFLGENDPVTGTTNPDFLIYEAGSDWTSQGILERNAPADAVNYFRGMVAENVIGVWFRLLDSTGGVITNSGATFDSRTGYIDGADSLRRHLPAAVEVTLALVDPNAARRIDDPGAVTSQYSRMFSGGDITPESFRASLPAAVASGTRILTRVVDIPSAR